jgi:allantoicase
MGIIANTVKTFTGYLESFVGSDDQSQPKVKAIPLHHKKAIRELESYMNLTSESFGAEVLEFSDEFFAPASSLVKNTPAENRKGHFSLQGAVFDGWETRRHALVPDYAIIKLGYTGAFIGFDVDTAHFNGNHPPSVSLEGALVVDGADYHTAQWQPVLENVPTGPDSRHFFCFSGAFVGPFTHIRLRMHPDGGVARLRSYGTIVRPLARLCPDGANVDVAHVGNGGEKIAESYGANFSPKLLHPSDSVTERNTLKSKSKTSTDQAIIQLANLSRVEHLDLFTNFYIADGPRTIKVYGIKKFGAAPSLKNPNWFPISNIQNLEPGTKNEIEVLDPEVMISHIKIETTDASLISRFRAIGVPYGRAVYYLNNLEETSITPDDYVHDAAALSNKRVRNGEVANVDHDSDVEEAQNSNDTGATTRGQKRKRGAKGKTAEIIPVVEETPALVV